MTPFGPENDSLRSSWQRFEPAYLDSYLVSGVEDPRINLQSILTRALLADTLWPNRHTHLIEAELRFALALTCLLNQLQSGRSRHELLEELMDGRSTTCPNLLRKTYRYLQQDNCPVPDYLTTALLQPGPTEPHDSLHQSALNTFCHLWQATLANSHASPLTVLEPACGSANDYRFLHHTGLARFLNYTGFDIAPSNITNARQHFSTVNFFTASILDNLLPDQTFDIVFVHDLFEHLSPAALERALDQTMRLTHHLACLHFFNADNLPQHQIRPTARYHCNRLSIDRLTETLQRLGGSVEIYRLRNWTSKKFAFDNYYNPQAVTILVEKQP